MFTTPSGTWWWRSTFIRRILRPAVDGNLDATEPTVRTVPVRPGLTFHGLRHSHKTWLIADNIPEIAQARRLGHHLDNRIVETYSHVAPGLVRVFRHRVSSAPGSVVHRSRCSGYPREVDRHQTGVVMRDDERREVRQEFDDAVNMTAEQLRTWLDTDESRSVGDRDGGESTGHASGWRIATILETKAADRTDDDHRHMRKVVGYVHRHLAQRPDSGVRDTPWRYSLMNWGHDPLEDGAS